MYITALTPSTPITVFSVHAPTETQSGNSSQDVVYTPTEKFYKMLHRTLNDVPSKFRRHMIILVAFNAQIGPPITVLSNPAISVRGPYITSPLSHNGAALLGFCIGINLVIANTYFSLDEYGTWLNPRDDEGIYTEMPLTTY